MDPLARKPAQLLSAWPTLVDVAEAVAQAGARVSVIQACSAGEELTVGGVSYHFIQHDARALSIARSNRFLALLKRLAPDVIHVHGLGFPQDVLALAEVARPIPIVVQDHASPLPRPWRRRGWRGGLAVASGVIFTGTAQAEPFRRAGLLPAHTPVFDIPESSSRFTPGSLDEARRITGLYGDPCLLWVGHLDANKDPLTVLDGIRQTVRSMPGLRLWCCYSAAPLLRNVRRHIHADPLLAKRVQLIGPVLHTQVEEFMRAADFLVLGSHREGSGYALIEALACGLPPVVTDIPSFSSLTGHGRVGALWPIDDSVGLCNALVAVATKPRAQLRAATRLHFEREISFAAIGRKLVAAYGEILAGTQKSEVPPSSRLYS